MSEKRDEDEATPVVVDAEQLAVAPGAEMPLVFLLGDIADVFGFDVPERMRGIRGTITGVKMLSSCATPMQGTKKV